MSTQLETNLNSILTEKTTKIIPGNIRKDVTILGVTGTYEGSSSGGIKVFSTKAQMQSDPTATIGDLALVYGTGNKGLAKDSVFNTVIIPTSITFASAMTGTNENCNFQQVKPSTSMMSNMWMNRMDNQTPDPSDPTIITHDYQLSIGINGGSTSSNYNFTSQDGLTYTRSGESETVVVPNALAFKEDQWNQWNNSFNDIIQTNYANLDGIYVCGEDYDVNKWTFVSDITFQEKTNDGGTNPGAGNHNYEAVAGTTTAVTTSTLKELVGDYIKNNFPTLTNNLSMLVIQNTATTYTVYFDTNWSGNCICAYDTTHWYPFCTQQDPSMMGSDIKFYKLSVDTENELVSYTEVMKSSIVSVYSYEDQWNPGTTQTMYAYTTDMINGGVYFAITYDPNSQNWNTNSISFNFPDEDTSTTPSVIYNGTAWLNCTYGMTQQYVPALTQLTLTSGSDVSKGKVALGIEGALTGLIEGKVIGTYTSAASLPQSGDNQNGDMAIVDATDSVPSIIDMSQYPMNNGGYYLIYQYQGEYYCWYLDRWSIQPGQTGYLDGPWFIYEATSNWVNFYSNMGKEQVVNNIPMAGHYNNGTWDMTVSWGDVYTQLNNGVTFVASNIRCYSYSPGSDTISEGMTFNHVIAKEVYTWNSSSWQWKNTDNTKTLIEAVGANGVSKNIVVPLADSSIIGTGAGGASGVPIVADTNSFPAGAEEGAMALVNGNLSSLDTTFNNVFEATTIQLPTTVTFDKSVYKFNGLPTDQWVAAQFSENPNGYGMSYITIQLTAYGYFSIRYDTSSGGANVQEYNYSVLSTSGDMVTYQLYEGSSGTSTAVNDPLNITFSNAIKSTNWVYSTYSAWFNQFLKVTTGKVHQGLYQLSPTWIDTMKQGISNLSITGGDNVGEYYNITFDTPYYGLANVLTALKNRNEFDTTKDQYVWLYGNDNSTDIMIMWDPSASHNPDTSKGMCYAIDPIKVYPFCNYAGSSPSSTTINHLTMNKTDGTVSSSTTYSNDTLVGQVADGDASSATLCDIYGCDINLYNYMGSNMGGYLVFVEFSSETQSFVSVGESEAPFISIMMRGEVGPYGWHNQSTFHIGMDMKSLSWNKVADVTSASGPMTQADYDSALYTANQILPSN